MRFLVTAIAALLLSACGLKHSENSSPPSETNSAEASSYIVPPDSMSEPLEISIDESKLKKRKAGNPIIISFDCIDSPAVLSMQASEHNPLAFDTVHKNVAYSKIDQVADSFNGAAAAEGSLSRDSMVKYENPNGLKPLFEKDDFKNDVIRCMLRSETGDIWFGTASGISKYDGRSFTYYTEREGLINNDVYSILEDKSGLLWIGTASGIVKFDGKIFTQFSERGVGANKGVLSIYEDKSGNLWFGTEDGLLKYDGNNFIRYTEEEGLSNNSILSILEDEFGNLWLGTFNGVSKFDGNTITYFLENEGFSSTRVLSMLEDKSGNLWFGTFGGGVFKYDGRMLTRYTNKEGLSNNFVCSMLEDDIGNLWFSTFGGGVTKYDGKTFAHYTEKSGLSNNVVLSILEGESGTLWFGAWGGSITRYNGRTFTYYRDQMGLSKNNVWSILKDKTGDLWFGTYGGASKFDGVRFTRYSESEGLCDNNIRQIIEDSAGNLWFATFGGGVSNYDGKTFTTYSDKVGLSSNYVMSICEDKTGALWIATCGGGLTVYNGDSFQHFTARDGLSSNYVFRTFEDKAGSVWLETSTGLSRLTPNNSIGLHDESFAADTNNTDIQFRNYLYDDGLMNLDLSAENPNHPDKDNGRILGYQDRLAPYSLESSIPDTIAPNIQITAIELYNEPIQWSLLRKKGYESIELKNGMLIKEYTFSNVSSWYGVPENLSLTYNNNYLTFNFIGVTMNQPKRVKYQYKLEGMDDNWSGITSRNEATYSNLPQGTYTFLVKAMNSEGVWSEPFQYTFTIRPPWWKTWWAYGLYVLIGLASISSYLRWRDRIAIKRRKVLQQKVTEATAEIRLQKEEVEKQKQRSDELLLNILPEQVAEELKERGEAEAKLMDNVTVLFTDFKGFTQLSEKLTPQELVSQIHEYFSAFDAIVVKYGIEKIKTIGDAYMAAGGLPEMNETHAHDVIMAAIEINAYMLAQRQKRQANGEPYFEIRIGIHTGPVVAGIVGVKKFQYDIWGDTVNTASRMESAGEPGKINISESTFELIKDRFNCDYRGEIDAKGKGKMKMYFVSDVARDVWESGRHIRTAFG